MRERKSVSMGVRVRDGEKTGRAVKEGGNAGEYSQGEGGRGRKSRKALTSKRVRGGPRKNKVGGRERRYIYV